MPIDTNKLTQLFTDGLTEAVAKAIAEHEREGRGDMVRAAQAGPDGCRGPHREPIETQNPTPHA